MIDGFMPTPPPGKLSGLADNIQAFAKNLDGSLDEVVETTRLERLKNFAEGNCSFDDVLSDFVDEYVEAVNSNKLWSWRKNIASGNALTSQQRSVIKRYAIDRGLLPDVKVIPVDGIKYGFADFKGAGLVEVAVDLPKDLWLKSDAEQFKWLDEQIGGSRLGMTWHHTEIPGRMELVPFGIHNITSHNGGRTFGMWAYAIR
ncbi:HNH endonuclease [Streptococcus sp. A22]|uniref:HNH endonuclease signature motif containing protein n=1 Tax=Streptococcus sp. A22 TaxID=3373126 RepID=UPI002006AC6D|nr:HNH endonuclease [Streptococcus suis]